MSNDPVQTATGERTKDIAWMVAGAAAVAVFVVPFVQRYLPVTATLALIVAGAALAYFGKGVLRKMGQGAALVGVSTLAMGWIAPLFQMLNPFGGAQASKKATAPGVYL